MALRNPFERKPSPETPPAGPLDQQLFAPQKPPAEPIAPQPEPSVTTQPVDIKLGSLNRSFDVAERALYQANYRFTKEENEAMDDLKLELSRDLGSSITKNDVLRLGLHFMIEDYVTAGDQSYLIKKLRKKNP
jgi:hypothetical protein